MATPPRERKEVTDVTETMRALVVLEPERFEVQTVAVPEPGPMEVLCRVRAVSICGTDSHLIAGDYPGFWPPAFPIIPGHEWAGEIVRLGPGAEKAGFQVGDRVAGTSHDACGITSHVSRSRTTSAERGVMALRAGSHATRAPTPSTSSTASSVFRCPGR
jgi:L-iditol 2-dehydrogenase